LKDLRTVAMTLEEKSERLFDLKKEQQRIKINISGAF
jgi:hypothetical protein